MPSCFNVVPSVLLFLFSFHLIFHAWFPHDSDLSVLVSNFCFQFLFPYMMFIVVSPFSRGFPEVFPQLPPQLRALPLPGSSSSAGPSWRTSAPASCNGWYRWPVKIDGSPIENGWMFHSYPIKDGDFSEFSH